MPSATSPKSADAVLVVDNISVRTHVLYTKIDSSLRNYTTNNFSVAVGPTVRF